MFYDQVQAAQDDWNREARRLQRESEALGKERRRIERRSARRGLPGVALLTAARRLVTARPA